MLIILYCEINKDNNSSAVCDSVYNILYIQDKVLTNQLSWASARGEKPAFSPLEIRSKKQNFLENLKSEA